MSRIYVDEVIPSGLTQVNFPQGIKIAETKSIDLSAAALRLSSGIGIDGQVLTHKVRIHLFSKHTHYWFSYTLSTSTPQHTLYLHFHAFTLTHHLGCGIAKRPTYRKNTRWSPSNFWAESCKKRSYIGQISLYESDGNLQNIQ